MSLGVILPYLFSFLGILPASPIPDRGGIPVGTQQNVPELFQIGRLKYDGGGDWYNDPSALNNLIEFARLEQEIPLVRRYVDVEAGSRDMESLPFAFLTGHGAIRMSDREIRELRGWLERGGFLYVDDDYGLDEHIRPILERLYPQDELVEVTAEHPIFQFPYRFDDGLPKIHEHDGKAPQAFAIFHEGRMTVFYTYESNLGDGWTDPGVHQVPPSLRLASLRMGTNILAYALNGGIR